MCARSPTQGGRDTATLSCVLLRKCVSQKPELTAEGLSTGCFLTPILVFSQGLFSGDARLSIHMATM